MSPTQTPSLSLSARARAMDEDRIALLLTLADEPDLILAAGQPAPVLDPADVAAARLAAAWAMADRLNACAAANPARAGLSLRAAGAVH